MSDLTQETDALLAAATERPRFASRKAVPLLRRWLEHDKAQREEIERLREVVDEWKRHVDVLSDDILAYEEHGWCGDGCGLCDDANKARDALDKWKELRDA